MMTRLFLARGSFVALLVVAAFAVTQTAHADATSTAQSAVCSQADSGVVVHLSTTFGSSAPGVQVGIGASVQNKNSYPITDGALFVRVYKVSVAQTPTLVDQFVAAKAIGLTAGGSTTQNFSWRVPMGTAGGTLRIAATIVTAQHPFVAAPALPASHADGTLDLAIEGGNLGTVTFDKKKVTVGSAPYSFDKPLLTIAGSDILPITALIRDNTHTGFVAHINWQTYAWDYTPGIAPLVMSSSTVVVQPGIAGTSTVAINDTHASGYVSSGILDAGGNNDVLTLAIARAGTSQTHLSNIIASSYPLTDPSSVTTCIRGVDKDATGQIDVRVTRANAPEAVIAIGTHTGALSDAVTIPLQKVASEGLRDFDVTARLSTGEQTINSVTAHYSCSAFGFPDCPSNTFGAPASSSPMTLVLILIILLGLAGYGVIWAKQHRIWEM